MKDKTQIKKNYELVYLSALFLLFSFSCGLSDIGKVNHIDFQAHPKVVVPIAYGTIDIETLLNYVSTQTANYPPDSEGYFHFEQIYNQLSIPDTFAFDGTMLEQLNELELRIETHNHIPLGIDLQLNFVDTLTFLNCGDPVNCPLLVPAVVDSIGKAIATTHHIESVIIPESQFSLFTKANAMIIVIGFYLPTTQTNTIYLNVNDFLSLNIGLSIQVSTSN